MEGLAADPLVATVALVGIVVLIAALLSGLTERSGVPQVAILLCLGAALGPAGLGWLEVTTDSPVLRAVAMLALALVLFTDALGVPLAQLRQEVGLTLLVLGPGTMLTAALIAGVGWLLLDLPLPAAAVLGAALASTDPVLLRGLLRRGDLPDAARRALRLESGLNDAVLLPVVLVGMTFMAGAAGGGAAAGLGRLGFDLLVLSPAAGVVVALLAIGALELVRKRVGVRRDYESLYSIGVAFAAFAAAESVHGSGFLAAFAAGLTIAAFDVELCDCFREYGETTAELTLLLAFILFGSSLIWRGVAEAGPAELLFAAAALLLRPVAFFLSLAPRRLDRRSRWLIAWFGPRGLSSLLLVLLPVFAGAPGSERLFSLCTLVVLASVVLHGASLVLFGRGGKPRLEEPARVGIEAVEDRALVIDARSESSYAASKLAIPGAVRLAPDRAVTEARRLDLPHDRPLVVLCA